MSIFQNTRIGTRLGLTLGCLMVGVVVMAGLALFQMNQMAKRVQVLADVGVQELVDLSKITAAIAERGVAARHLVLEADPVKAREYVEHIRKASAKVESGLTEMTAVVHRGSSSNNLVMRQKLVSLRESEQRYLKIVSSVGELVLAGRREDAAGVLLKECRPAFEQIFGQAKDLEHEVELATSEHGSRAQAAYQTARTTVLAGAFSLLLMGCILGWLLTQSITKPLRRAVDAAESVAAGDLTVEVNSQNRDEAGDLLRAINGMVRNLSRVVAGVRSASDSIATGTGQIAVGNADLSQRTEAQASNLEQTAASMEEIHTTVQQNAAIAAQAAELARSASAAAERGGSAVGEVVSTMESISRSSGKVVEIISVIDGIAFQTNILALNAAVEAARAGEQGRGFAVVAGEVRVLAQRSAAAAKEIKQLIANSADRVEEGTRLVADAGSAMDDILTQVRRVYELIEGINKATAEQTAGISQVNAAVSQLDQSTQQNAALVEQSAAAAESLRQQARQLVEAVSAFRLSSQHRSTAAMGVHEPDPSMSGPTGVAGRTSSKPSAHTSKHRAGNTKAPENDPTYASRSPATASEAWSTF